MMIIINRDGRVELEGKNKNITILLQRSLITHLVLEELEILMISVTLQQQLQRLSLMLIISRSEIMKPVKSFQMTSRISMICS
jgi:hypothetical protein